MTADKKKILAERAKTLSVTARAKESTGAEIEVVEFTLALEQYAVESGHVRETLPLRNFTPLPCVPSFVFGIISLRGQIISVIDIKKFFDLPDKGVTDLNRVIVLKSGEMEFGILADSITGTRLLPVSIIQPSLPTLTGIRSAYLMGVTPDRTIVLDAKKLLHDKRIIVNEDIK